MMSESPQGTSSGLPASRSGAITRRQGEQAPSLQSERGTTTVADAVVAKIAGIAAREVAGVHALGGTVSRAVAGVAQQLVGTQHSQGVSVEVGERQTAVDLSMIVEYGEPIPRVVTGVRDNIINRIETLVGLEVTEVNISVNDLYFPGDDEPAGTGRVE